MQVDAAQISLLGNREENQDRVAVISTDEATLLIEIDGMGGHAAGDVASKTVVSEVFRQLKFECDSFLDQNTNKTLE